MVSKNLDRNLLYGASSSRYVDTAPSNSELFCNLHTSSYGAFPVHKQHIFWDRLCDCTVVRTRLVDFHFAVEIVSGTLAS